MPAAVDAHGLQRRPRPKPAAAWVRSALRPRPQPPAGDARSKRWRSRPQPAATNGLATAEPTGGP
eukprot:449649-Lingulodinium_polyedra.AAC.1